MYSFSRKIWLFGTLGMATAFPTYAAEEITEVQQVVVTATRTEMLQEDVPGSVTVITAEQIEESNAEDLLDVIRSTTGISLVGRGVGGRKVMSIRGMESRHSLILINGHRIAASDDVIGHSDFEYSWVPLESIERIEIVRGPMSSLYGSEALGGVINIITKPVSDTWQGVTNGSLGTPTDRDGGDHYRLAAHGSGPLTHNIGLSFSVEKVYEDDTRDEDQPQYSELEGKEILAGEATLSFALDERQTLELTVLGSEEERWRDTYGRRGDYRGDYDIDRYQTALSYRGRFGSGPLEGSIYRSWEDADYRTTAGFTSSNTLIEDVAEVHGSTALGENHLLSLGGEYRQEALKNRLLRTGETDATHWALFAQDEISLGEALAITAGLRWDHHEYFGSEISPRIYAVYKATDKITVKGGYGHGFKAPSLKRVSPDYVFRGPHTFHGNPNLQPEVNDSFELGVSYAYADLEAALTLFRNDIDDLISYECITNCDQRFGREFLYVNVDEARTQGVETELTTSLTDDLHLAFNYTYLDAKDTANDERLEARPRHNANVSLTHHYAPWGLKSTLRAEYIGEQMLNDEQAPGYSLWHLAFIKSFGKRLELRAGVKNIGDVRLADKSDKFDYVEQGRVVYAGLKATF